MKLITNEYWWFPLIINSANRCPQWRHTVCSARYHSVSLTSNRCQMTDDVSAARGRDYRWTINLHQSKPNYRRGEGLSGGKCGTRLEEPPRGRGPRNAYLHRCGVAWQTHRDLSDWLSRRHLPRLVRDSNSTSGKPKQRKMSEPKVNVKWFRNLPYITSL